MSNRVFWSAVTVSFRVLHACHSQWLRQFVALEWIRHVGGLLTALLPAALGGLVGDAPGVCERAGMTRSWPS
jgi:hypothetical protein